MVRSFSRPLKRYLMALTSDESDEMLRVCWFAASRTEAENVMSDPGRY